MKNFKYTKIDRAREIVYMTMEEAKYNCQYVIEEEIDEDMKDYAFYIPCDLDKNHELSLFDCMPVIHIGNMVLDYSFIETFLWKAICILEFGATKYDTEEEKKLMALAFVIASELKNESWDADDSSTAYSDDYLVRYIDMPILKQFRRNHNNNLIFYCKKAMDSYQGEKVNIDGIQVPIDALAILLDIAGDERSFGMPYNSYFVEHKGGRRNAIIASMAGYYLSGKTYDESVTETASRLGLTEDKVRNISKLIFV